MIADSVFADTRPWRHVHKIECACGQLLCRRRSVYFDRLRTCVRADAAELFADFVDFGLRRILPARLVTRAEGGLVIARVDRRLEASSTSFDCCLSQPISDRVKGLLTTKDPAFEFGKTFQPVAELFLPEGLELVAMAFP